jgi:hypothetical protein
MYVINLIKMKTLTGNIVKWTFFFIIPLGNGLKMVIENSIRPISEQDYCKRAFPSDFSIFP